MRSVYKGAPELKLSSLSETTIAAAIVGTGAVIAVLSALFWLPFVHAKVVKRDYTIRWFHFFYGPLLWRRPAPEVPLDAAISAVPDYRTYGRDEPAVPFNTDGGRDVENRLSPEEDAANSPEGSEKDVHHGASLPSVKKHQTEGAEPARAQRVALSEVEAASNAHPIDGLWILPKNLWIILRYRIPKLLLHGSSVDVHKLQLGGTEEEQRITEMHERAKQYDNEVSSSALMSVTRTDRHRPNTSTPSCRFLPRAPTRLRTVPTTSQMPLAPTPPSTTSGPTASLPLPTRPRPRGCSPSEVS
jgi:sodium-dependent phosphate transporter